MPPPTSEAPPRRRLRWLESLLPFLAIFGVMASLIPDYRQMADLGYPGIDFQIVYVSTRLLTHGQNPYDLTLTPAIYAAQGLTAPPPFGHAPVYPQFTFAALSPFALFNGPTAVWLALILSSLLMAAAVLALVRFAETQLNLTFPWRLAMIAAIAACPLLAFGLQIGNVSVAASAFCILALVFAETRPKTAAAALTAALLLKPHLALWPLIALATTFGRPGRRVALRAILATAAFAAATALWLAAHHQLLPQLHAFAALLHAEQASGSMSPGSHQTLPLAAQITSLTTLPAYFGPISLLDTALCLAVIAGVALLLARAAWQPRGNLPTPAARLQFTAAAVAFGLLATYHRAHDATLLVVVVIPCILARLRTSLRDAGAWILILSILGLCLGADPEDRTGLQAFFIQRQAALAILCFALTLAFQAKKYATNDVQFVAGGQ